MNYRTEFLPLIIALKPEGYRISKELATEQTTQKKCKQVYLNTLAVYTVHSFLEWMEVETDLEAGDSWNPYICGLFDATDLVIPNLGKIECRPVMSEDTVISLSPEVKEDRIAYVGVRFQEQLDKVELLGFIRAVDVPESSTTIKFDQLEPIENLIDYLFRLESGIEVLQEEAEVNEKVQQQIETTPMSIIVTQLERIYRNEPEYEWRAKGGEVLLADTVAVGGAERESSNINININEDEEIEAQDLAESLLDKLAEIWGEAA